MKKYNPMRYLHTTIKLCIVSILFLSLTLGCPVDTDAAEPDQKAVAVQIPVSCEKTDTEEVFHYEIEGIQTAYEHPQVTKLDLRSEEKGEFWILYTYPGTYHYTVSQAKGTDAYTTYDDTIYKVDVYVTEQADGRLTAEPVLYREGANEKKEALTFTNIRKVPEPAKKPEKPKKPKNPEKPESAKKQKTASLPVTGKTTRTSRKVKTADTQSLYLWITLLAASGVSISAMTCHRIKKRREDRAHG